MPEETGGGRATIGMTGERWFVDTNVLVYLFDDQAPAKRALARGLFSPGAGKLVLSAQVLGEFFQVVTRKTRTLTPEQALRAARSLSRLRIWPIHRELVLGAMRRSDVSRLSYWDALIVETAIEAQASRLLTEDLRHGQRFGPVRVVNPFRPD